MESNSNAIEGRSSAPCSLPSSSGIWDIRIQCTVCGIRVRRNRKDYPEMLGEEPKATLETECSNCTCQAGYPSKEIRTLHFIDFATDEELQSDKLP